MQEGIVMQQVSAREGIATILHRARMAGGWDDEAVAVLILSALGLDEDGYATPQVAPPPAPPAEAPGEHRD